ncbi:amino acid carrier protein [Pseudomonadota bacterium]|nr:amino acid carrier protein [Pseudomonadota bacterium]
MLETKISYIVTFVNNFESFVDYLVTVVWGIPLVACVVATSAYLLFATRLKPYFYLKHAFKLLFIRKENRGLGTNSHWGALTTALGGTIGMGNIAGVAIALQIGGSGAIFWMWITAAFGMIIKFFSCSLSCVYRQNVGKSGYVGGSMYTIILGLGNNFRWLSYTFSFFGMIGCLGIFQANQLSAVLLAKSQLPSFIPSIIIIGLIFLTLNGGVKRLGSFSSVFLPIMGGCYLIICLTIIIINLDRLGDISRSIFLGAFDPNAAIGGVLGLSIRDTIITGVKRAIFSNEAGVGTETLAHSTAKTEYPIREGLVAMIGPILDTHVICTATALIILSTDLLGNTESMGILLVAEAIEQSLPGIGASLLTAIFSLFALSTMITYAYYSTACAKYFFGEKIGQYYIYFYLLLIFISPYWSPITAIGIIDIAFALMTIPNLISIILLAPVVLKQMNIYFKNLGPR